MKADQLDIEALSCIIRRLEDELKTKLRPLRQTALEQQLRDARELRAFLAKEAGIKIRDQ